MKRLFTERNSQYINKKIPKSEINKEQNLTYDIQIKNIQKPQMTIQKMRKSEQGCQNNNSLFNDIKLQFENKRQQNELNKTKFSQNSFKKDSYKQQQEIKKLQTNIFVDNLKNQNYERGATKNGKKFCSLSSQKTNNNFPLGNYKNKFVELNWNEDQIEQLSKNIKDFSELRNIYQQEFKKSQNNKGLYKLKNTAKKRVKKQKEKLNNELEEQIFYSQFQKREQVKAPQQKENNLDEGIFIDKASFLKQQLKISQNQQQNSNDEQIISGLIHYDLSVLSDSTKSDQQKMQLLMKDIRKQLKDILIKNNIGKDKQKNDEEQKKNENYNKKEIINNQKINCLDYIKQTYQQSDNFYEEIIEYKQTPSQTFTQYSWGQLYNSGNSYCYQGDIRNQKMWKMIKKRQMKRNKQTMFSAIIMDAPWVGTAIDFEYPVMKNDIWMDAIPIDDLQKCGYLFMWITNSQLMSALQYFQKHNYKRVDSIVWLKVKGDWTVKQGIGYYFHHGYEECLVGQKQDNLKLLKKLNKRQQDVNVIVSEPQETSRKPERLYEMIERLMPNGYYLEIFGRKYNQRENWITVGNESIQLLQKTKQIIKMSDDKTQVIKVRKV